MNRVRELQIMVEQLNAHPDKGGFVSVSAAFLRGLWDEVRDDEMLTPKVLARILMHAEGVAGELTSTLQTAQATWPQVVENMEKLSGRAHSAEKRQLELERKLAVMERAAGVKSAAALTAQQSSEGE